MTAEVDTAVLQVLVVDDHRTFAELLAAALQSQPDLNCVAKAYDAESAEALCAQINPDVVVVDVDMPGCDGITLAGRLTEAHPELRVVIVTAHATPQAITKATEAGACAFVPKNGSLEDMLSAIRFSRLGSMSAPTSLLMSMNTGERNPQSEVPGGLTPREYEVLTMLAEGLSVQQISRRLSLSVHTTRGYVKTLLTKLDAHSQLEAVLIAARRGIIQAA